MTENPFEVKPKSRKTRTKTNQVDIEAELNSHTNSSYQSVSNKYLDFIFRTLLYVGEHKWGVIMFAVFFVPELAWIVIIISYFSEDIIKYIKSKIQK